MFALLFGVSYILRYLCRDYEGMIQHYSLWPSIQKPQLKLTYQQDPQTCQPELLPVDKTVISNVKKGL